MIFRTPMGKIPRQPGIAHRDNVKAGATWRQ